MVERVIVMTNGIVNGICKALHEVMPDAEIYTESVEQGLSPPCFAVASLELSDVQKLGTRHFRRYPYVVHYFPRTDQPKAECYDVLDKLYDAMQYINADFGLLRGGNMHGVYDSGMLHFYVTYSLFTRQEKESADPMEELHLEEQVE